MVAIQPIRRGERRYSPRFQLLCCVTLNTWVIELKWTQLGIMCFICYFQLKKNVETKARFLDKILCYGSGALCIKALVRSPKKDEAVI